MIYKYEKACQEAGMKEEDIKAIRRMFDADYKKLKRRIEARQEEGGVRVSIEACVDEEEGSMTMDLASDYNLEDEIIHNCDLERLNTILEELSLEDRLFILDYFEDNTKGCLKRLAEKYNLKDYQARDRKNRLITRLKKRFFEEF